MIIKIIIKKNHRNVLIFGNLGWKQSSLYILSKSYGKLVCKKEMKSLCLIEALVNFK